MNKKNIWIAALVVLALLAWAHTHRYKVLDHDGLTVVVWDRWRQRTCLHTTMEVQIETMEEAWERRRAELQLRTEELEHNARLRARYGASEAVETEQERLRRVRAMFEDEEPVDSARAARIEQFRADAEADEQRKQEDSDARQERIRARFRAREHLPASDPEPATKKVGVFRCLER